MIESYVKMVCCEAPQCLKQRPDVKNTKLMCDCYVFKPGENVKRFPERLCQGNMFVAGSMWMQTLQSALLGSRTSLFPVIEAASPPPPPPCEKPKPMKYTDLPIHKAPHAEYNSYQYDYSLNTHCCGYNEKLWQKMLLPHVVRWRHSTQNMIKGYVTCFKRTAEDIMCYSNQAYVQVCKVCRDDRNLVPRQVAVATAATLGYVLTNRKLFVSVKKILAAGVCATLVGGLCFPAETDEALRNVGYEAATFLVKCYNFYEGANANMSSSLPCACTMPGIPPPRRNKCREEREKREAELAALLGGRDPPK